MDGRLFEGGRLFNDLLSRVGAYFVEWALFCRVGAYIRGLLIKALLNYLFFVLDGS